MAQLRRNTSLHPTDIGKILIPMDTYYSAPKSEFNDWFEIKATENMIPEDEEVEMQTDLGRILRIVICNFN